MSTAKNLFNISCRPISFNDLPSVIRIENSSYEFPWSEKIFQDCISANYISRVAIKDYKIVGYVIASILSNECHVMNLCIDKKHREEGLGRYLLQDVMIELSRLECDVIFLECRPSNIKAKNLYESEGFCEVGLRKNYYPVKDGHEDAILYAKQI